MLSCLKRYMNPIRLAGVTNAKRAHKPSLNTPRIGQLYTLKNQVPS